jgi:hypothetical protein
MGPDSSKPYIVLMVLCNVVLYCRFRQQKAVSLLVIGPHSPPNGPKMARRWPTMARDGSKMVPQDGPELVLDGPKMASRWPQDGPRWPQDDQDDPNMAQEDPKLAQDDQDDTDMAPMWHHYGPNIASTWPPNYPS